MITPYTTESGEEMWDIHLDKTQLMYLTFLLGKSSCDDSELSWLYHYGSNRFDEDEIEEAAFEHDWKAFPE